MEMVNERQKMGKTMSTNKVLTALLEEWNEQQLAKKYSEEFSDPDGMIEAFVALHSISCVIDQLGFKEGIDYTSVLKEYDTSDGKTFPYWERKAF